MKITTNIMLFYQVVGLEKTIDIFADAGFDGIEFNTDLKEYYDETYDRAYYEQIRAYAEGKGLTFTQSHAPFASSFSDPEQTRKRFEDIVKGMEHSAWLGAETVVVHPCGHLNCMEEGNWDRMMDYNLDFYRRLAPYAKELGLQIAIENINSTVTRTAEGLNELMDRLNDPVFVICYDVGHAHIAGEGAADMIRKLGNRIKCTHIHDNDGVGDNHTLPYYGSIDWEAVTEAFAQVGYAGNLNYEAGNFVKHVPASLMPQAAAYMAQVGHQLIDRVRYHGGMGK